MCLHHALHALHLHVCVMQGKVCAHLGGRHGQARRPSPGHDVSRVFDGVGDAVEWEHEGLDWGRGVYVAR